MSNWSSSVPCLVANRSLVDVRSVTRPRLDRGAPQSSSRLPGIAVAAVMLLASCAQAPSNGLHFSQPIVLLGEVHDNELQHRVRLQAFRHWLATGARPALVMEQFDRDRQRAIDELRATTLRPDADALIAVAGGAGWNWSFYRPFIALALEYDLPVVAANVSRDEARRVMRDGLEATGFRASVPPEVLVLLAKSIEESHCGMVDADAARHMALAQVARDQAMASAVEAHSSRGVVALAGNGHVRTDAGIPRWLSSQTRGHSEAIGLLEEETPDAGRFDRVVVTPRQARKEPCESMRSSPSAQGQ